MALFRVPFGAKLCLGKTLIQNYEIIPSGTKKLLKCYNNTIKFNPCKFGILIDIIKNHAKT